jgi:hypothetical protein
MKENSIQQDINELLFNKMNELNYLYFELDVTDPDGQQCNNWADGIELALEIINQYFNPNDKVKSRFQEKIDKITKIVDELNTVDGKIELDPTNPSHKEWFEEE